MNEKHKKIIIGIAFAALFLCIFVQSIADNITIRRADITIDTLERELRDTQNRLADCKTEVRESRAAITDCRQSVERIADSLDRQSGELTDIIENLKQVRAEIEVMENTINLFYDKHGNSDNDNNNTGGELK